MTTITGHLTDALAQRYVDGVLGEAEAAEISRHAAACLECSATVESYRMLSAALEDLEVPALPASFTEDVLALVDARERALARERRYAVAILATVFVATAAVFAVLGAGAWAPVVASIADGLGGAARAVRIGAGFVPALVKALRLEIILAVAAFALPLLLALARLMPAPTPRAEVA
jgi:anti-sigma factor RsiW